MQFHPRIPRFGTVPLAVMACVVVIGASCAEGLKGQSQSNQPNAQKTTANQPELYGGDQLSWLTNAGDNADSSFCDARLKLPFDKEPVWENSYTDAVFSSLPFNEIVHYDGLLVVSAYTTQLMGLDARTGERLFNEDVYYESGRPERTKRIRELFFNPCGMLSARDNTGRVYGWDITDGNLTESWVFQGNGGRGGRVADSKYFFAGGRNRISGINANSGEVEFEYPTMYSSSSILMSESGLIVCWQNFRTKLVAFDRQSWHTKWAIFFEGMIESVVIGNGQNRAYVATTGDRVYCLDLQTGEQLWDYGYAWLLDQETRKERAGLLKIQTTRILPVQPVVGPWGYCLVLSSGDVLLLSDSGELKWHYQADSSVSGAIGFNNALLVMQFWEPAVNYTWPDLAPFNLTRPNWKEITATVEARQEKSAGTDKPALSLGMFARIVALDIENGEELDAYEPEEYTYGSFIPAYNNIILTKVKGQREAGSRRGLAKWIVAYNWLEEGSK